MSRAIPKWEPIEGDLATPLGFRAAAVAAGIKKTRDALDLALIFSDSPATTAAGVFTTNRVAAAPVLLSRQNLVESRGRCRAIVVNSGNANACTGREGLHTAEETARVTAELLGIEPSPSPGGIDRSHWRPAQRGPYSSATPPSERKALQGERQGRRPRHPDH